MATRKGILKHKVEFDAWLAGEEIEYLDLSTNDWEGTSDPAWNIHSQYRVKPKTLTFGDLKMGDQFVLCGSDGLDRHNGSVFLKISGNRECIWLHDFKYSEDLLEGLVVCCKFNEMVRKVL